MSESMTTTTSERSLLLGFSCKNNLYLYYCVSVILHEFMNQGTQQPSLGLINRVVCTGVTSEGKGKELVYKCQVFYC